MTTHTRDADSQPWAVRPSGAVRPRPAVIAVLVTTRGRPAPVHHPAPAGPGPPGPGPARPGSDPLEPGGAAPAVRALTTATRPPDQILIAQVGGAGIPLQRSPVRVLPDPADRPHPADRPDTVGRPHAADRPPIRGHPDTARPEILALPAGTSFGAAVAAAVRHSGPPGCAGLFYWLLPDGVVPAPDALDRLLTYARVDPSASVLGPKLLDALDPGTVLEAGVTVDRAGSRITGVAPGEPDRGQHDAVRDVLAVSCAGMLVRAAAWETLGGLAEDLTTGLDLDLGWRAARAGLRVVAVPPAVAWMDPAARPDTPGLLLPPSAGGDAARPGARLADRLGRVAGVRVRLSQTPASRLPAAVLGLVAAGAGRACARLTLGSPPAPGSLPAPDTRPAAGSPPAPGSSSALDIGPAAGSPWTPALPGRAGDPSPAGRWRAALTELLIVGAVLARPGLLARMRARAAVSRRTPRRATRNLLPGAGARGVGSAAAAAELGTAAGTHTVPPRALAVLVALLAAAGAVAVHALPSDAVGGGLPMPVTAGDLWSVVWSGWQGAASGSFGWPGSAPPWTALLATLASVASLVGADVPATCAVVLAACPAAAAISAYRAAARLARPRSARVVLAALYAVSPPVAGSVIAGRIETAAALALLPAVLATADEFVRGRAGGAGALPWRAWRLAVGLAVLTVCAPVLLPVAALGLPAALLAARRAGVPGGRAAGAAALAVLVAAAAPLVAYALPDGPENWADAAATSSGAELTGLLAGAPGDEARAGALSFFVVYCLTLTGCVVLGRRAASRSAEGGAPGDGPLRGALTAGWSLAAAAVAVALAVPLATTWSDGRTATTVSGLTGTWVGPQYGLACAGLLIGVGAGLGAVLRTGSGEGGRRAPHRGRRAGRAARFALLGTGLLVAAGVPGFGSRFVAWTLPAGQHAQGGAEQGPARPVAALSRAGGPGARVLVLRQRDSAPVATYTLAGGDGPAFPAAARHRPSAADRALAAAVADLSAGVTTAADRLPAFGVVAVVVPADTADGALVAALDAVDGLSRDRHSPGMHLWRLPDAGAAGSSGGGAVGSPVGVGVRLPVGVGVRLPVGAAGRLAVLTEPADPGWRATVDGQPLPAATVDGWAQAFVLPAGGGLMRVSYDHDRHRDAVLAAAGAGGLLLVAGLPAALTCRRAGAGRRRWA